MNTFFKKAVGTEVYNTKIRGKGKSRNNYINPH